MQNNNEIKNVGQYKETYYGYHSKWVEGTWKVIIYEKKVSEVFFPGEMISEDQVWEIEDMYVEHLHGIGTEGAIIFEGGETVGWGILIYTMDFRRIEQAVKWCIREASESFPFFRSVDNIVNDLTHELPDKFAYRMRENFYDVHHNLHIKK